MTGLLILVISVLVVLALVYLLRIYDLSRDLKGEREENISASDNRRNAQFYILFMLGLFGSFLWLAVKYSDMLLPRSASEHGNDIDFLMDANLWLVTIVFFIINFLLFTFAYRFIRENREKADYFPHNNKLELFWTIVPSIFLAFIIIYGLKIWNKVTNPSEETLKDAIVVELYARQFDWTIRYAGADNKLGNAHVRFVEGANTVGIDPSDPAGKDDILVSGDFVIPVDKTVRFQIRSQDVIHSAYFPHFRAQINAVPGMKTFLTFKPTVTTEEMRRDPQVIRKYDNINKLRALKGEEPVELDYTLLCNKICGGSHYNMKRTVSVVSFEEFTKWINEKSGVSAEPNAATTDTMKTTIAEVK